MVLILLHEIRLFFSKFGLIFVGVLCVVNHCLC